MHYNRVRCGLSKYCNFLLLVVSQINALSLDKRLFPDVSYEDLEDISSTCPYLDNCKANRMRDNLQDYNCLCTKDCDKFNSCCVDSPHRKINHSDDDNNVKCLEIYGRKRKYVFMINSCKANWRGDIEISLLCSSSAESSNDPFLAVAVTSKNSGLTYKNYYCYLCNEDSTCDTPVFWDVVIKKQAEDVFYDFVPSLNFKHSLNSWTTSGNTTKIEEIRVSLSLDIPDNIKSTIYECRTNVISSCSESWRDDSIRKKCRSYTAIIMIENANDEVVQYKNPHCAICNSVDISDYFCQGSAKSGRGSAHKGGFLSVSVSVPMLCGLNAIYDRFSKTCRSSKCGPLRADTLDVTYTELQEMDVVCPPHDSCRSHQNSTNICNCQKECTDFNDCCIDSKYRTSGTSYGKNPSATAQCDSMYGEQIHIYSKSKCKSSYRGDPSIKDLCYSDPEFDNDPILAVPVTSKVTNITYRNLFCYRCNEEDIMESPVFWSVALKGPNKRIVDESLSSLSYDKSAMSWISETGTPVVLEILVPDSIKESVFPCQPHVISECSSQWTNRAVIDKCQSYKALIKVKQGNDSVYYRNAHCAICNFIDISLMTCVMEPTNTRTAISSRPTLGDNQFIGMFMLSDKRCSGNMIYDKRAQICREGACLSRQYVKRKGRCERPGSK